MARYFAHYWNKATFKWQAEGAEEEGEEVLLDHTASNLFRQRRMKPGDFLYVWSYLDGDLYLVGRMQVSRIVDQDDACKILAAYDLWEADDHALAAPGTATLQCYDLKVPLDLLAKLRFWSTEGSKPVIFRSDDRAEAQTFRGFRELMPESAKLLDGLLEKRVRQD